MKYVLSLILVMSASMASAKCGVVKIKGAHVTSIGLNVMTFQLDNSELLQTLNPAMFSILASAEQTGKVVCVEKASEESGYFNNLEVR